MLHLIYACFNSNLVRLKELLKEVREKVDIKFQFQSGTIKST